MSNKHNRAATRRRTATALGFLAAFVLTVVTIIYTGLLVKAPRSGTEAGPQPPRAVEESSPADHGGISSEQGLEVPGSAGDDADTAAARRPSDVRATDSTADPQPPEALNTSD